MALVLDSGAVAWLADDPRRRNSLFARLRVNGHWPPLVITPVLVECTTGSARDATTNRFLQTCDVEELISPKLARRAAQLRTAARQGSAIDALVVAAAEPGGTVMTTDAGDLRALAAHSIGVRILAV